MYPTFLFRSPLRPNTRWLLLRGIPLTEMNYPKIGVQGFSLGNLQLTTDELVWTSGERQVQAEIQTRETACSQSLVVKVKLCSEERGEKLVQSIHLLFQLRFDCFRHYQDYESEFVVCFLHFRLPKYLKSTTSPEGTTGTRGASDYHDYSRVCLFLKARKHVSGLTTSC